MNATQLGKVKKPVSRNARTAPAKPKSAPKSKPAGTVAPQPARLAPEQRYRMIAEAAYFRAERRGFLGGDELRDWLDAEAEIDRWV